VATRMAMDDRGLLVTSSSCGQRNRIPHGRTAKCGKCGTALPDAALPVDVPSVAAFDALVRASRVPVVVDFWAEWCGPCKMVAPELVKVAERSAGRWLIVKVDTEALPELAQRYQIQSIPTMAVYWGGREVGRTAGARPAPQIEQFVAQTLLS
jgi:thioredoxin 2